MFDLSKIDWLKCEEFALKNIIKEVCGYWNNKEEWETTTSIAKNNAWGIRSFSTIIKYLKRGAKLGWTNYCPKEEMRKSASKNGKAHKKAVEVFKDDISCGIFDSTYDLERISVEVFGVKFINQAISDVCNNKYCSKNGLYKGYKFKYVDKKKEVI